MDMILNEISPAEYAELYVASHVYNGVPFTELNACRVDSIHYLSFGDAKQRIGIILGERDGVLCSPFSAPFGGFEQRGVQSLQYMEKALLLLADYAEKRRLGIKIALPPLVYGEGQLSKWVNVFTRAGFKSTIDLNYFFPTFRFADYTKIIDRSARNHLNRSKKEGFRLLKMKSDDYSQVARAYEVIRRNREERGYPLKMSLEQVWQTVNQVIKADFFVLEHEGNDIAAAQIFHVAEGIAQVIYWGDIREYSETRPMNYLSYAVFEHYYNEGVKILDIGPSTEGGIPNYGLCEFKENTGCDITLKYWFEK